MHLINKIYLKHKNFWSEYNMQSFLLGVLLFLSALIIQHFSYSYIEERIAVTPVRDLLLDNLPTVNLDFFIVQGSLLATLVIIILLLTNPNYLPFSLKSLALFLIVRSFFISLTHLGADLNQITLNSNSIGFVFYDFLYNAKNDFFFSGHVGISFLFALIFWTRPFWRNIFIVISFIFGITMILAHMHYSIDIFAAPFITYGIFVISKKSFPTDFKLLNT